MLANVSQCLRTTVTELACRLFFFLFCFGVFLLLKVHRRLNFHKALQKVNLTGKHNNTEDAKRYLLKSLSCVVNFLFGKQFLYRLTSPCHPASPPLLTSSVYFPLYFFWCRKHSESARAASFLKSGHILCVWLGGEPTPFSLVSLSNAPFKTRSVFFFFLRSDSDDQSGLSNLKLPFPLDKKKKKTDVRRATGARANAEVSAMNFADGASLTFPRGRAFEKK